MKLSKIFDFLRRMFPVYFSSLGFPPENSYTLNLSHLTFEHAIAELKNVPKNTTHLAVIQYLILGERAAVFIAEHLGKLTSMDVWGNNLGEVDARNIAKNLNELTSLDLYSNEIGDAGVNHIAKHLNKLTSLNLSSCGISETGARNIVERLNELTSLDLTGNGLINIPDSALNDIRALRRYFQLADIYKKVPNNRIRTMLVGEPHSGKTTVFELLKGNPVTIGDSERTHGVDQYLRTFSDIQNERLSSEKKEVTLDIWDIGGQKLQHMCHGWFFRPKAIYIFILDSGTTEKQINYWLNLIHYQSRVYKKDETVTPNEEQDRIALREDETRERKPARSRNEDPHDKPIIIPFFNQKKGKSEKSPKNIFNQVLEKHKGRFNCEGMVTIFFERDDKFDQITENAIKKLLDRINIHLEEYEYNQYLELIDNIKPIFEGWPEDCLSFDGFSRKLSSNSDFQKELQKIKDYQKDSKVPDPISEDGLIELIRSYLDFTGIMSEFEDPNIMVKNPSWIRQGVYCLFPPEDENRVYAEKPWLKSFIDQIKSIDSETGLPGIFTSLQLKEVLRKMKIPRRDSLIQLIEKNYMGLLIRLDRTRYFVPTYLDECTDYNDIELEEELHQSFMNALYCHVLESDYWPPYFIYRYMVWATDKNSRFNFTLDINKSRRKMFFLKYNDETYFKIIFYDQKLWCFAYSKDALTDLSTDLPDRLRDIKISVSNILTTTNVTRVVPCPHCIKEFLSLKISPKSHNTIKLKASLSEMKFKEHNKIYRMGGKTFELCGQSYISDKFYHYLYEKNKLIPDIIDDQDLILIPDASTIISLFIFYCRLAKKEPPTEGVTGVTLCSPNTNFYLPSVHRGTLNDSWHGEPLSLNKGKELGGALIQRFKFLSLITDVKEPNKLFYEYDDAGKNIELNSEAEEYLISIALNIYNNTEKCITTLKKKKIIKSVLRGRWGKNIRYNKFPFKWLDNHLKSRNL